MVSRERHTLFATDPLARPLKEVDCDEDCEQSLIFLCKVTARESSKHASGERQAAKPWDAINEGLSPTKESAVRLFSSRPNQRLGLQSLWLR